MLKKRNMRKKSNEPYFDLKLPGDEDEDSDSNYWVDSLSDRRETVVEFSEGDRRDSIQQEGSGGRLSGGQRGGGGI